MTVDQGWVLAKHLEHLNWKLVELAKGNIRRLMVFMPPRHGKSELCSHYFPAWYLALWPDNKVILASYEASFAAFWGRQARDVLEEYGDEILGGVMPRQDSRAASNWQLDGYKGGMITAGVRGAITGRGANVFIIDDPVKNDEQALSETYREKTWDWYRSVARTRLEPNASIVLIMTRWHEDDLAGRLLKEASEGQGEQWEVIEFPAFASDDGDVLDRDASDALWPDRFSTDNLRTTERTLGTYWWNALYQQRPQPEGGGILKLGWLRRYTTDPQFPHMITLEPALSEDGVTSGARRPAVQGPIDVWGLRRYAVVDLAITQKETSDWTVIGVFGRQGRDIFLLDLFRRRMDTISILNEFKRVKDLWRLPVIYIERTAFQLAIIDMARERGLPIRELEADRDKVSRAYSAAPTMEGGYVWIPKWTPWLAAFENEVLSFPTGTHDDQVDVLVYGVAYCQPTVEAEPPPMPAYDADRYNMQGLGLAVPDGFK